ncbi:hypothetical protein LTR78_008126 [Recurvomyces mirabilis]|uniref:NAD(P)-binding protein n=1 Tax=Recurvomyces mirabilis TaxID=574656 RepID=A0AAE0TRY2_9PEZI|nr:hypothetical protein LTR78_008126 [Recurvomyces mirabilis]KAK5150673.1 hypothetical protein LTS14_009956 [Recurvomyces mirabilis]
MSPKTVIVTGANRGIGQAICKLILQRSDLGPLRLYAASRSGAKLDLPSSNKDQQILFPKLDITSSSSIATFADDVKSFGNAVDVLINNAGVNLDNEYGPENAKRTLDVNYRGTLEVSNPPIRVIVASLLILSADKDVPNLHPFDGKTGPYSESLLRRLVPQTLQLSNASPLPTSPKHTRGPRQDRRRIPRKPTPKTSLSKTNQIDPPS